MKNPLQPNNQLVTATGTATVAEVAEQFSGWSASAKISSRCKLALVSENPVTLMSTLTHFFATGSEGFLTTPARWDRALATELARAGFTAVDDQGEHLGLPPTSGQASPSTKRIILQTSGTTGQPKLVSHTHASLVTVDPQHPRAEQRWLVPYLPGTYAWYQMATLALFSPGQHLLFPPARSVEEMWEFATHHQCTAISATPSFWRCLFLRFTRETLAQVPLRQITLGGEPVDQPLLDELHALFPTAQLTHIYASTESGAAIIVHDRREGFPLAWLNSQKPGRPALRLQNGRLWIKSPFAAADLSTWRDTGDRVEIRHDRAVVVGRQYSSVINVGGAKVDALRVVQILRRNPRVLWCRVFARPAPLVGELVAAEVVLAPDWTEETHETELTRFCLEQGLPSWMIPRLWTRCETLPLSSSLKSSAPSHA